MIITAFQQRKFAHVFRMFDHDRDGFIQRSDYIVHGEKYAQCIGAAPEAFISQQLKSWGFLQMYGELDNHARMSQEQHLSAFSQFIAQGGEMLSTYLWEYLRLIWRAINKKNYEGLNSDEFVGVMFSDDVAQGKKIFQLLDFEHTDSMTQQALFGHWSSFFWGTDPNSPSQWIFGEFE